MSSMLLGGGSVAVVPSANSLAFLCSHGALTHVVLFSLFCFVLLWESSAPAANHRQLEESDVINSKNRIITSEMSGPNYQF